MFVRISVREPPMIRPHWCTISLLTAALVVAACTTDSAGPLAKAPGISLSQVLGVPDCGFEDGPACPGPASSASCDRGLTLDRRGTPLNASDDICVNDTRHRFGALFRGTWVDWALANQRTLAIDEPINWVMHLSTHNAFNNLADGYGPDQNQVFSMSDQLDLGSRFLWLDLHWFAGIVVLCHGREHDLGCGLSDRPFAYGVQEIAAWLAANPDEIAMIDLEAYVDGHFDEVANPLSAFFGTTLYRPSDRTDPSFWPSRRELRSAGKRVIVGARDGDSDDDFRGTTHRNYIDGRLDIRYIRNFRADHSNGIVTGCSALHEDDPGQQPTAFPRADGSFWVVGEDRTLLGVPLLIGHVDPGDMSDLAACNVPLVSLDLFSCHLLPGCSAVFGLRAPLVALQPYAVWSWREGDRGDAGDAALLHGGDGRWSSAAPSERHRFACARPRSESTRHPAEWTDALGSEWRITAREGTWREGGRTCLDQFAGEGLVFSVPVNGAMNGQLRLADPPRDDVWLNYNDIKAEGSWIVNQRPVANAGADRTVECNGPHGTLVQLDGSRSADPDGDPVALEWHGPFATVTGAHPTLSLPLGRTVVTVIADDGFGGVSEDEVVIDVVDTTAPAIRAASAAPNGSWPPNHKMAPVVVVVDVSDACDADARCRIVSVLSNEPANGVGDRNTSPDWEITGDLTLNLRAERSGGGGGRVYTITVRCTDASGNASTTAVTVSVPHDICRARSS